MAHELIIKSSFEWIEKKKNFKFGASVGATQCQLEFIFQFRLVIPRFFIRKKTIPGQFNHS